MIINGTRLSYKNPEFYKSFFDLPPKRTVILSDASDLTTNFAPFNIQSVELDLITTKDLETILPQKLQIAPSLNITNISAILLTMLLVTFLIFFFLRLRKSNKKVKSNLHSWGFKNSKQPALEEFKLLLSDDNSPIIFRNLRTNTEFHKTYEDHIYETPRSVYPTLNSSTPTNPKRKLSV